MTEPKYVLLGIAGLLFFTISGLYMFTAVNQDGSLATDSDYKTFNSSFQKLGQFDAGIQGIKGSVDSSSSSSLVDKVGIIESLVQQSWTSFKLLLSSFDFLGSIFGDTAQIFGIPSFIVSLATLSITIVLVFGIMYIIFNRA
jgi:hypothetical protein